MGAYIEQWRAIRRALNPEREPVWLCSEQIMDDFVMGRDQYGIYAQRVALSKVMPGVKIFRGKEWWH